MRKNADCGVIDAGRGAEQDHPILRIELRRRAISPSVFLVPSPVLACPA